MLPHLYSLIMGRERSSNLAGIKSSCFSNTFTLKPARARQIEVKESLDADVEEVKPEGGIRVGLVR